MGVYYNELDRFAAQWIRNLQAAGHVPTGTVDERSIIDVPAKDLEEVHQAHFFAGIGGWPLALKLAGWPDEWPVWTGSCPCQPFSCAGKAGGVGDERHLWPAFYRLISECHPPVVFGEQVESKDGRYWLAGVRDDLERVGYAIGAADLCAAGIGAPHKRQRLYWVAYTKNPDWRPGERRAEEGIGTRQQRRWRFASRGDGVRMGESIGARLEGHSGNGDGGKESGRNGAGLAGSASTSSPSCGLGDSESGGCGIGRDAAQGEQGRHPFGAGRTGPSWMDDSTNFGTEQPTASETSSFGKNDGISRARGSGVDGVADSGHGVGGTHEQGGGSQGRAIDGRPHPWSESRVILCRDGKSRRIPLEPSLFPLAPRVPGRVGLLRGAGGAIVPQVAAEFVRAFLEVIAGE